VHDAAANGNQVNTFQGGEGLFAGGESTAALGVGAGAVVFYKEKKLKNLALFFCYLLPAQLLTEPARVTSLVSLANLVRLAAFG
jgi:hypothetical protein